MRRHALRDDQWELVRELLPGRVGSVGVTAAESRLFVEAVLYRYRTGVPWRDLPERFGDGVAVHLRCLRRRPRISGGRFDLHSGGISLRGMSLFDAVSRSGEYRCR